mmetsp:Transcript_119501/g.320750  ORF Transcript_119501/g.320750 Transcript_119501/m.320750 type:complete len:374 (-) Transcript_119501:286-1407(-)
MCRAGHLRCCMFDLPGEDPHRRIQALQRLPASHAGQVCYGRHRRVGPGDPPPLRPRPGHVPRDTHPELGVLQPLARGGALAETPWGWPRRPVRPAEGGALVRLQGAPGADRQAHRPLRRRHVQRDEAPGGEAQEGHHEDEDAPQQGHEQGALGAEQAPNEGGGGPAGAEPEGQRAVRAGGRRSAEAPGRAGDLARGGGGGGRPRRAPAPQLQRASDGDGEQLGSPPRSTKSAKSPQQGLVTPGATPFRSVLSTGRGHLAGGLSRAAAGSALSGMVQPARGPHEAWRAPEQRTVGQRTCFLEAGSVETISDQDVSVLKSAYDPEMDRSFMCALFSSQGVASIRGRNSFMEGGVMNRLSRLEAFVVARVLHGGND